MADAFARSRVRGVAFTGDGVLDGAIAGAAAQVALQRVAELGALRLIEGRRGHDHAGGTEAALEALRLEKRALHRVQFVALRQAFDGGHFAALRAQSRHQAGMHRLAVEIDRAGAAVAGVAAFLDAEPAELTQERAQALPGGGLLGKVLAVDPEAHRGVPANSPRISWAKCSVM